MKGLNQAELEHICDEIQTWVGAQLQEVVASDSHIALGFYHRQKVVWMMFDFAPSAPVFLLLQGDQVRRLSKKTKPLTLFIRAHFEGRRIARIELAKDQGRVLQIYFHAESRFQEFKIEVILFSYAKNLIASAIEKKISFFKPKEVVIRDEHFGRDANLSVRSFQTIENEWLIEKGLVQGDNRNAQPNEKLEKLKKMIQKKTTALEKMQSDIFEKNKNQWSEVGEWMKLHQNLKAPEEYIKQIDLDKTLSQNITSCFTKAKDQERKILVAQERAAILKTEIEKLKRDLQQDERSTIDLPRTSNQPKKNFLQKVGAQARTLKIDENLQAYIGKSAKDNLDILRRAQPFDLWLHLRDIPSAHVVIRRTRERQVSDLELRKIAQWLIAENFGKKAKTKSGESFDLIICECRHVKPIKGDKLGRVHFQNDRTLRIKFET